MISEAPFVRSGIAAEWRLPLTVSVTFENEAALTDWMGDLCDQQIVVRIPDVPDGSDKNAVGHANTPADWRDWPNPPSRPAN